MATEKNVTKPRAAKAAQTIDMTPDVPETPAPEQIEQPAGTVTDAPAPEQIDAPPVSETLTPIDPPMGDGKAADTAAGFKEELKVPAPEVPMTPLQQHTAGFAGDLKSALLALLKCRPVTEAAWIEPTIEQIKARRVALITERAIDPTDMDAMIEIGIEVKMQIDAERAAHAAASKDVDQVTRAYYAAALNTLADFRATMLIAYEKVGGQVAPPATTKASKKTPAADADAAQQATSSTAKTRTNWKDVAPKLIERAAADGLKGVYFRDQPEGGYKDVPHVVKLHADGRLEVCNADYTPTGVYVDNPLYYNDQGTMRTEGQAAPNVGGWKRHMSISMLKGDGTYATIPGVTENVGNSATAYKHYALCPAYFAHAGI